MKKKIDIPKDNNIIKVSIDEAMPDNYLPYAVEVAKDRALPDVRDGLKPVHRRILYGAYMLKAFPDKPYYKSARIVGDILGKYHPHGDASVYDAMVILAQNFTTRMPLIDGHGNWGSEDGDSAAAMRYTEARLTPLSMELLRDIEKDVVNMQDNYSGTEKEPEVLPARYPNLLVNGAFGIAVGLATNIPPHNLKEVIQGTIAYIDNNEITTKELMKYIKGPDLPTGGIIIGKNSLLSAYETGEGKVTLRAKTSVERLENGHVGIVITEFPYRRSKAKLLQIISEMTADKKYSKALEPISDIRDETDRTGIRAVIEFKKSADEKTAQKILKYLFKKTDLQCNLSFNMVALYCAKPETMGLKTIIMHYVDYQKEIVTKRTKKELEAVSQRFEIVKGFIRAIGMMDEILKTVRGSSSRKDAHKNLVSKFGFSDIQSDAILELMIYRLTGLEIKAFEKEYRELEREIKRLSNILKNEKELMKIIKSELNEISEKYGDKRRTAIVEDDEKAKIDLEELIIEEDIIVTLSDEGYIKRMPQKLYARLNDKAEDIEYREGDSLKYLFESNTKDNIIIFTDKGNMYQTKAVFIPEYKWKDKGEKLDKIIKGIDLSAEKIAAVYSFKDMNADKDFIFFTDRGGIKRTHLYDFITNYTKLAALKLRKNENLIKAELAENGKSEEYLKITTLKGLEFTVKEPHIEAAQRNIYCSSIFNLCDKDSVVSIEHEGSMEQKTFYANISDSTIRVYNNCMKHGINIKTDSSCRIIIFDNFGNAFAIDSNIIQNAGERGIALYDLFDDYSEKSKILNAISVNDFNKKIEVCFFTRRGMIKKTSIKEMECDSPKFTVYKFKNEEDILICIAFIDSCDYDMIMMTERGMCIRFEADTIGSMGRIASGMIGISLMEDDNVIYGDIIKKDDINTKFIFESSKKNKKMIYAKEIRTQGRAGRGKNIMLIVMDDYIVKIQKK